MRFAHNTFKRAHKRTHKEPTKGEQIGGHRADETRREVLQFLERLRALSIKLTRGRKKL